MWGDYAVFLHAKKPLRRSGFSENRAARILYRANQDRIRIASSVLEVCDNQAPAYEQDSVLCSSENTYGSDAAR